MSDLSTMLRKVRAVVMRSGVAVMATDAEAGEVVRRMIGSLMDRKTPHAASGEVKS